ncbi:hypothetical protein K3495_g6473 [Podosphaera aphanis]|nr:hypothetical protein K3495_g6473 [Podosphaera aphanis]
MLYEFHRTQNAKKPGTVHATYLVSGVRRKETPCEVPRVDIMDVDDGDGCIQSSPFMRSSSPVAPEECEETTVLTVSLIREENLNDSLSRYEKVTSIHVYSIASYLLEDLQVLSDVARQTKELCIGEDPLNSAQYGTIVNKQVKRRTLTRPALAPPASASAPAAPVKNLSTNAKETSEIKPPPTLVDKKAHPPSKPTSHDFFGKAKPKTNKAPGAISAEPSGPKDQNIVKDEARSTPDATDHPAAPTAAEPKVKRGSKTKVKKEVETMIAEDVEMKDVSNVEKAPQLDHVSTKKKIKNDKAKVEREAALRKMMEDNDDEDNKEADSKSASDDDKKSESPETKVEPEKTPAVPRRRRGRRRIMKKVTFKDEEGYLVTKEEPAWESFSEDEPVVKPRAKNAAASAKTKESTGKVTQGSIMSFFGKKQ